MNGMIPITQWLQDKDLFYSESNKGNKVDMKDNYKIIRTLINYCQCNK